MICLSCNSEFHSQVIDGIMRNLSKRNYCLECSPFRTRDEIKASKITEHDKINDITCLKCNKVYQYSRGKIHKSYNAKYCDSCYSSIRRMRNKLLLVNYKGGACEICGYNKNLSALAFHHIDPSTKKFGIATKVDAYTTITDEMLEEVDKTILICSNCHSEQHNPDYNQGVIQEIVDEHFANIINSSMLLRKRKSEFMIDCHNSSSAHRT